MGNGGDLGQDRGVRYHRLGRSDLDISVLVMGCGNFGGMGSAPDLFGKGDDEPSAYTLLDAAFAAGITMYDTANSYGGGRSEEWLGQWLTSRGVRDDVLVTTKVGNRISPHDGGLSAAHIRHQIDASLRRLNTDRVDLYLTHVFDPDTPIEETVGAFDSLIQAGKIRHYGMSNFTGSQLAQAGGTPVNLQNAYNLVDRSDDGFDVCARRGIGFTAYSPLAGGLLTGKYRSGVPAGTRRALRPDWYSTVPPETLAQVVDRLDVVAAARGTRIDTIALAWVLTDPGVAGAIIAPRTTDQLTTALAAVDTALSLDERAALTA
ncbi:aryl-alcohol dehydrogenase-like predicted oxidoreductase [Actinocrispum wychmicini]|uniref:Aryl-alcohol dehydrogenase-like predicted oxidoreductase n=1 Tax=Actinocrispum wychmicini TaxID=1213861 RepID=A0A4R2JTE5_9PSEU|nr:aryl-alcohol dehydrogenase-like predicted oxidoreductase [Actinocrispum wychmicini]